MHIKVYYRRYAYPHQNLAWCIFISAQVCDELLAVFIAGGSGESVALCQTQNGKRIMFLLERGEG